MDALVMCGGRGTRLGGDAEKPLVPVAGTPMVDRVLAALRASRVDRIHAVVSPATPDTRAHLVDEDAPAIVDAPGDGYVADLSDALEAVGRPALTVAADLPLLDATHVDDALVSADGDSLTVCVPAALKRRLGASADATFDHRGRALAPTGLNVVADADDRVVVRDDPRLAVNVNRPADLRLAAALAETD